MHDARLYQVRSAMLQAFLQYHDYDGILINRADNFSMATGGRRNLIYTYGDIGGNGLFVTRDGDVFYAGNTIERDRCMEEELLGFGCEELVGGWWDTTPAKLVEERFKGRLVSDDGSLGENVHGQLAPFRALLSPIEQDKYRRLGALAAEAMTATLKQITRGMLEADIAALLKCEGGKRHCQVPVALIAADERATKYRHPIPTENSLLGGEQGRKVERFVMVVACFLKEGLVCSMTRICQVEELPDDIVDAYRRICSVDARVQMATRPDKTLGEIFKVLQAAYVEFGFPADEWRHHHQGGAAGYTGRSCKAAPTETFAAIPLEWARRAEEILGVGLQWGTAYAWNPSAPNVKSEDTFLMLEDGSQEILSLTPELPTLDLGEIVAGHAEVVRSGIYSSL